MMNTTKTAYCIELSEDNKKQFLIPKGFAHGFLVLSDVAEFCYKCDDLYHPNDEGGIAWNNPILQIDLSGIIKKYNISEIILSEKDKNWKGIDTL